MESLTEMHDKMFEKGIMKKPRIDFCCMCKIKKVLDELGHCEECDIKWVEKI